MKLFFLTCIYLFAINSHASTDTVNQRVSFAIGTYIPYHIFTDVNSTQKVLNTSSFRNRNGLYFELNFRSKNLGFSIGHQSSGKHYEMDYLQTPYWYSTKKERHQTSIMAWRLEMNVRVLEEKDLKAFIFCNWQMARINDYIYKEPLKDSSLMLSGRNSYYSYENTQSPYCAIGVQGEFNLLRNIIYLQTKFSYTTQLNLQNGYNVARHFAINLGVNLMLSELFRKEGIFLGQRK